eukprot:ANDGO_06208.mRNA.1 hypothetical protein
MEQLQAQLHVQLDYNNQLLQQLQSLEREHLDTRRELASRDAAIRRLQSALSEAERGANSAALNAESATRGRDALASQTESLRAALSGVERSLQDTARERDGFKSENEKLQHQMVLMRSALEDLQRSSNEQEAARSERDTEIARLRDEISRTGNHLHNVQRDCENWQRQANDANTRESMLKDELWREHQALESLRNDMRNQVSRDAQARREAEESLRSEHETQMATLRNTLEVAEREMRRAQAEAADLHGTLQRIQNEQAITLRNVAENRAATDDRVRAAEASLQGAEVALDNLRREADTTQRQLMQAIDSLRLQLNDRTEAMCQILEVVRTELRTVHHDEFVQRNAQQLARLETAVAASLQTLSHLEHESHQLFESIFMPAFRTVCEERDGIFRDLANLNENHERLGLAVEEERARTLAAEQKVASLEQRIRDIQEEAARNSETLRKDFSRHAVDLERSVQQAVQEAATRGAMADEARAQRELVAQQLMTCEGDRDRLRAQLNEAQNALRNAVREAESNARDRDAARRDSVEKEAELSRLQMTLVARERELDSVRRETAAEAARMEDALRQARQDIDNSRQQWERDRERDHEAARKTQTQLAQTQALLLVVQEQRKALQDENSMLRADLEGIYKPVSSSGSSSSSSTPTPTFSQSQTLPQTAAQVNAQKAVQSIFSSSKSILQAPNTGNANASSTQLGSNLTANGTTGLPRRDASPMGRYGSWTSGSLTAASYSSGIPTATATATGTAYGGPATSTSVGRTSRPSSPTSLARPAAPSNFAASSFAYQAPSSSVGSAGYGGQSSYGSQSHSSNYSSSQPVYQPSNSVNSSSAMNSSANSSASLIQSILERNQELDSKFRSLSSVNASAGPRR